MTSTPTKRTVTKLRKKLRVLRLRNEQFAAKQRQLDGTLLVRDLHVRQLIRENNLLDAERTAQSEFIDEIRGIVGPAFALQRPSCLTPEESSQLMSGKLMVLRFRLGMSTETELRGLPGNDESAD